MIASSISSMNSRSLLEEDAARRQRATQFGHRDERTRDGHGGADSGPPSDGDHGKSRRRAAEMITGSASYTRLNQILAMERVAADRDLSAGVRQVAADELERIRNGGPVDPGYQRVRAVVEAAERRMDSPDVDVDAEADAKRARDDADRLRRMRENRARRAAAAANAKRSVKSFAMVWREMDGWSKHYDAHQVATELSAENWAMFNQVLEETSPTTGSPTTPTSRSSPGSTTAPATPSASPPTTGSPHPSSSPSSAQPSKPPESQPQRSPTTAWSSPSGSPA